MRDINSPPASDADQVPQPSADLLAHLRHPSRSKWTGASARQPIQDVEANIDAAVEGKGRFLSGSHTNRAGTRDYKLYIPSGYTGQALPLVVMLHGCTQHPDDFAAGTGMNLVAEDNNCFVVYPAQAKTANGSNCWNWFKADDQRRDNGEPALIAGITREIIRDYKLDASRVYIAGMSAGGAMAAVMAATYPELYAAVGIHSGLPYAVAHDLPSALAAMKKGKGKASARNINVKAPASLAHTMPVIVFHGDRDTTVHPSNGDQVLTQCVSAGLTAGASSTLSIEVEQVAAPNGHAYTRSIHSDAQGKSIAEKWIVHGAGHAWSGGSSKGSYTDPKGPDATREMLRFFLSR
jgi:poly(hydroxyalkanoate) depolymerase family esterase